MPDIILKVWLSVSSIKKDALKNFAKFKGKHLCQSLFFNKVADLLKISQNSQENTCARVFFDKKESLSFFLKKESLAQVFSCEFCEIFKNTFFYRTPPGDCF